MKKWIKNINEKNFLNKNVTAAILAFTLLFSPALPNILLIPLVLLILFGEKDKRFIQSPFFVLFAGAVLVLILTAVVQGTFINQISKFTRHILFLILFIVFYQVTKKRQVENAYLIGAITVLVISSILISIEKINNSEFMLSGGEIVNDILLLERPYFGIALVIATFITLKRAAKNPKYYLLALLFTAFNIYISARLAIVLCIFLFFIYAIKNSPFNFYKSLGIGLGLVFILGFSLSLSDNFMKRMHLDKDYEKLVIRVKAYEPRFIIWPCAHEIIKKNNYWGIASFKESEAQLVNCYASKISKEDKRNYYTSQKFNTHNQFLDYFLMGGWPTATLLLLSFFIPLFMRKTSFELKMILLIFLGFFLVENVIHRQLGRYLFAIFAALYSKPKNE
ncbi:MAG: O-antigen ligase family protein [Psychroflexus sp.]|nr:O-antigen ligase family protein [Psychroflexus sp.]MDN6310785.1 O-antigen ligase family protein [Psychroflexus sp.]